MKRAFLPFLGLVLLLEGCTMIPRYNRPLAPVPEAWPAVGAAPMAGAAVAAAETPWHDFFADDRLRRVIELSLGNNRDLRKASLAVERAKAEHRIQAAALYPSVGVQASAEKDRIPERIAKDGVAYTSQQYSVYVGTSSWEIDLFGRIRSLKAAALEQYLATEQSRRAALVSLVGAVAATYLDLAADAEQVDLARDTLESQSASYDLVSRKRDAGVASDVAVRQAQSQVESARVALAAWSGQLAIDRNALDLLAGTPVPAELLPDRLGALADAGALAPGLPSETLLLRPDILAAEHQLMAANANIGAARAAFFPRISLTAAVGTLSPALSSLFAAGTRTWTFNPVVQAPLWAGGSLKASLKVAKVDREIAVAEYEKAIQVAFSEVSDGLALRATLLERRQAQEALVTALDQTYRLSSARYEAGIDSYLSVLDAQRALFSGQQELLNARLAEQANVVTLYKALGGGA
jgi:multidrug efflux system outer membrane protein